MNRRVPDLVLLGSSLDQKSRDHVVDRHTCRIDVYGILSQRQQRQKTAQINRIEDRAEIDIKGLRALSGEDRDAHRLRVPDFRRHVLQHREAAGDVDVLLLDKTGTITLGDRQAFAFLPAPGITEQELADAAQLASLSDETPEGRSIVVLAKQRFQLRGRDLAGDRLLQPALEQQHRRVGLVVPRR